MRLARRLRQLRTQHWPDSPQTQTNLARVFSAEEKLASATVSSWESPNSPKLPPRHRLRAYARFFATQRSVGREPKLLAFEELTPDEQVACKRLEAELFRLRSLAAGKFAEEETNFSRRSWHFADNGPVTLVCAELPSNMPDRLRHRRIRTTQRYRHMPT